jgi:hypothetical protein
MFTAKNLHFSLQVSTLAYMLAITEKKIAKKRICYMSQDDGMKNVLFLDLIPQKK